MDNGRRGRRRKRTGRRGVTERQAAAAASAGRRRWRRRVALVFEQDLGSLVQFLALHAAVLEPDLDLAFAEVQLARDLPALLARDVRIADELVFEHHCLVARVRLPLFALPRKLCTQHIAAL